MKFKKDAIKPGMVIHCPKKEDARALLKHLDGLGYKWVDGESLTKTTCWNDTYGEGVYYTLDSDKYVTWKNKISKDGITEFSDLIEPEDNLDNNLDNPQDNEMGARELLEWMRGVDDDSKMMDIFGCTLENLFDFLSNEEILGCIKEYEAAKKAPKLVEVEWVDVCRIYKLFNNDPIERICAYEEELPDNDGYATTENILKKYISEHEGQYVAVIEGICRVKEGESQ